MSFFDNTRKPSGFCGKIMVNIMNLGHALPAKWGFKFLSVYADADVLDCGCGGGANIRKLLEKCPNGTVDGIDYSPVSVRKACKLNKSAIRAERCTIKQGSIDKIEFPSGSFDAATAFETVYFWPDIVKCFREVNRVLKPGGIFLICNECGDKASFGKWEKRIEGMTIYEDMQLKAFLEQSGFLNIETHKNRKGWLCMTGQKAEL